MYNFFYNKHTRICSTLTIYLLRKKRKEYLIQQFKEIIWPQLIIVLLSEKHPLRAKMFISTRFFFQTNCYKTSQHSVFFCKKSSNHLFKQTEHIIRVLMIIFDRRKSLASFRTKKYSWMFKRTWPIFAASQEKLITHLSPSSLIFFPKNINILE